MIRAEEQALIADFKAVPKAERHRLREISTEEAYLTGNCALPQNLWKRQKSGLKNCGKSGKQCRNCLN